jgi:hypothetical protein
MRHHLNHQESSKPVVPLDTPSGPPNENQFCLLIVSLYSDVFFAQRTTEYPISHGPEFKSEFDKPAFDQQHYH